MTDEYELMPHKAVEKLKREVEKLRKKASPSSPEIKKSIENLSQNINSIKTMFEQAAEDIKKEEVAEEGILGKLDPIQQRVDDIEDENIKIAQAILAIAEMIKEKIPDKVVLPEFKRPMPTPAFRQAPPVQPKPPVPEAVPPRPQGMPHPIEPPKQPEIPKPIGPLGPPIRAPQQGMPPMGPPNIPRPMGVPSHPPLEPPKPQGMPLPPGLPPELHKTPGMPPPIGAPSPAPMPPGPMPTPLEPKKKGFFAKLLGK